ncbi:Flp pilus assembly protein CpaB [Loktanella sp. S4079]|uniref:Flp pilus assembly protein CpaB n=1 Tax=Loktanella sp. S4079 TaxID=579483 RepID=UPI0005F9F062|nr:Flp pilus assembly protein CpaB [Loktanella sp. S4079]KJZ18259.1 pilus assembly protein CpaB [Loktanella sp. S4079]
MRGVFGLVLVIGMGLAGFAVYMVNQQIEQKNQQLIRAQRERDGAVRTVDVYSPNRSFTYGEVLTEDDLKVIKYAQDFLPEGVIRDLETLFPPEEPAKSRVVILPIIPNEPLTESRLAAPGASRGLTALVAPGMRAFPIRGRTTGSFGTLRPNDRIDLYWTGRLSSGREVTNLLKANMQIIAVPDESGQSNISDVILQVTPEEVAILTQAQASGSLTMSLVGSGDTTQISGGITVDTQAVTGEIIEEVIIEEEVAPEICYRYERRGTERVQIPIPCN